MVSVILAIGQKTAVPHGRLDVWLKSTDFEIGERGFLTAPRFETLGEIQRRIAAFENWSVRLVEFETRSAADRKRA